MMHNESHLSVPVALIDTQCIVGRKSNQKGIGSQCHLILKLASFVAHCESRLCINYADIDLILAMHHFIV